MSKIQGIIGLTLFSDSSFVASEFKILFSQLMKSSHRDFLNHMAEHTVYVYHVKLSKYGLSQFYFHTQNSRKKPS